MNELLFELSPLQLTYSILLASTIVWFLKLYSKTKENWNPNEGTLSFLVYVASYGVAFLFGGYNFPDFPSYVNLANFFPRLLTWSVDVIAVLSIIAGMAMLVYNVVWKKILEWFAQRAKNITAKVKAWNL